MGESGFSWIPWKPNLKKIKELQQEMT